MSKTRWIVASTLALAGVFAAGAASAGQRGGDVQWSVTIGGPVGAPVYTVREPVYAVPAPVHGYPAPVYTRPAPVYAPPHLLHRVADPYYRPYRHHRYYQEPTHWDHDGDGIPNRHDRLYNPRWDVDGDGIPNRHDRDRDGDGIPNWHERDNRHWRGR